MGGSIFVRVANSVRLLFTSWVALLVGSALVYSVIEHSSLLDGIYWAVVTATTLGYGDLAPHTPEGKVLTGMLISVTSSPAVAKVAPRSSRVGAPAILVQKRLRAAALRHDNLSGWLHL